MAIKKRRKKKSNVVIDDEVKIEQTLLKNRCVFLFSDIEEKSANEVIKNMLALDCYSAKPILFYINSEGGSVYDGLAIIDCMKMLRSPVITIILGQALSMGAIISIFGDKRVITSNSTVMFHDMSSYNADYTSKIKDRLNNTLKLRDQILKHIKSLTKLTDKEIKKSINGELWLTAEEAKEKGVVDFIINSENREEIKEKRKKKKS